MNGKRSLIAGLMLFAFCAIAQAAVGYKLDVTTEYIFGGPPGGATPLGCCTGNPDTGFVVITNNGTTTFTGTIGATAISGFGVNFNQSHGGITLAPGNSVSLSVNDESSNQGGYGGPFGTLQNGITLFLNGSINGTEAVNLSVNDANIHSGVTRSADGHLSDSYVIQGGDPFGGDTGDAFETTQAAGHFEFFEAGMTGVPEPGAFVLLGTVLAMIGTGKKLFRKAN